MHCLYTHQGHIISLIYINNEPAIVCFCFSSSLPLDIFFFFILLFCFSSRLTVSRLCVLSCTVCHPGASGCLSWLRVSLSWSQVLLIPSKFDVCVGGFGGGSGDARGNVIQFCPSCSIFFISSLKAHIITIVLSEKKRIATPFP